MVTHLAHYSYHNLQRRHPLGFQGDESFITNTHLGAAYPLGNKNLMIGRYECVKLRHLKH